MSKTFTRGKVVLDVSVDLNSGNIVKEFEKNYKILNKIADDKYVNLQMELDESGKIQLSNYLKELNAEAAKGIVIDFNESVSAAQFGKISSKYKQWATSLAQELTSILSDAITKAVGVSDGSIVDSVVGSSSELSKVDEVRKKIDGVTDSIREKEAAIGKLQKKVEQQAKAEERAIARVQQAHANWQKKENESNKQKEIDDAAKAFAAEYDDFLEKGYDTSKLGYKNEYGKIKTEEILDSDYDFIVEDLDLTERKLSNAKKKLIQNQGEFADLTGDDLYDIEKSISKMQDELQELATLKDSLVKELDDLIKKQDEVNKKKEQQNKKQAEQPKQKKNKSGDESFGSGGEGQVSPPDEPLKIPVTPAKLEDFYTTIEKYRKADISVQAAKESLNELYTAVLGELNKASENSTMKFVQSVSKSNARSGLSKHHSIGDYEKLRAQYEDNFVKNLGNNADEYKNEIKNLFNIFSQKTAIGDNDIVRLIGLKDAYQQVFDQQIDLQDIANDVGYEFSKIEKKYDSFTKRFDKLKGRKLVDGIKTEISGDDVLDLQINPVNIEDFYHKIENYSTLDLQADISKKSVEKINDNIKGILENLKKVIDGVDEAKSSAMQAKKDVAKQQKKSSDVKTANQLPSVKEQAKTWTTRMKDHVKVYSKSDSDSLIQRMGAIIKQAVDSETKKLNRAQEAELAALEKVYQTKYDSKWSVEDILAKQNLDKGAIFTDYQDLLGLFKDRSLNNTILKLKENLEEAKKQASEKGTGGKGGKKEDQPPVVIPVELDPNIVALQEKLNKIEPKLTVEVDLNPSAESLNKITQAASSGVSQQINDSVTGQQPVASGSKPKPALSKAKQKAFEEINWTWSTSFGKSEEEIYDWIKNILTGYANKGKKLDQKDATKIAALKEMYKLKAKERGEEKTSPVSDILKILGVKNFDDILGENYSKGKKSFDDWSEYTKSGGSVSPSKPAAKKKAEKPAQPTVVDVDLKPNIEKLRSDLKTINPPLVVDVTPVAQNTGSNESTDDIQNTISSLRNVDPPITIPVKFISDKTDVDSDIAKFNNGKPVPVKVSLVGFTKDKNGTSATAFTNAINAIVPAFEESATKIDDAANKHVTSIGKIRDAIKELRIELKGVGATSITEIVRRDADELTLEKLRESIQKEREALQKEKDALDKQKEKDSKKKKGKSDDTQKSDVYEKTRADLNKVASLKKEYEAIAEDLDYDNILKQMVSDGDKNILLSDLIHDADGKAKNALNKLNTEVFKSKDAFEAAKQEASDYIDKLSKLYSKQNQKNYQQGQKDSRYVGDFDLERSLDSMSIDSIEAHIKDVFKRLGYQSVEFKNKFNRDLNSIDVKLFKDGYLTNTTVQLRQMTTATGKAAAAVNSLGATEEKVIKVGDRWITGLKAKLQNLTQYITGIELVMKALNEAREGFNFVKELDTSMTTIYETMDITRDGLAKLSSGAIEAAKNLGAVSDQMIDSVNIYAAYGKTVDEILNQATPTVMLANAMQGSAEDASTYIQAVVQQYKELEGQEIRIINAYEKIAANIQVDFPKAVGSIAEGVQVAGSVAESAGLAFEQYAASVAKVAEVTRQEGSSIGNAYKTILARTSRSKSADEDVTNEDRGEAARALASVGIDVYDANGEFQDFSKTLDQLSAKWSSLSDSTRAYIAESMAGVRNINVMQTIIETWSESQGLANSAIEDSSYYLTVQEKHIESMQAKLNTLRATVQEFWYNLIDTGAVNFVIEVLTKLVELGNLIINTFKSVGGIFGEPGAGIGGFVGAAAIVGGAVTAYSKFKNVIGEATESEKNYLKQILETLQGKNADNTATVANTEAKKANNDETRESTAETIKSTAAINARTDAINRSTDAELKNKAAKEANNNVEQLSLFDDAIDVADDLVDGTKVDDSGQIEFDFDSPILQTSADDAKKALNEVGEEAVETGAKTTGIGAAISGFMAKISTGFSKVASTLGMTTTALGWVVGGIAAIGAVIGIVDLVTTTTEEAAEAVKKLDEAYAESQSTLSKNKSTIASIGEEFEELSKGVNSATGNNLKLTTDEFERYHVICNQIAEMYPDLVKSYDAQGNAILNLKGNLEGLNEAYDQQRLNAAKNILGWYDANTGTYANASTVSDNFNNAIGNRSGFMEWWEAIWDVGNNDIGGATTAGDVAKALEEIQAMTYEEFQKWMKKNKDTAEFNWMKKNLGISLGETYSYVDSLTGETVEYGTAQTTQAEWLELQKKMPSEISKVSKDITSAVQSYQNTMRAVLTTLEFDDEFKDVEDDVFRHAETIISILSDDMLEGLEDEYGSLEAATKGILESLVGNSDAQVSLDNILKLGDESSLEDLKKVLIEDLEYLSKVLNLDKNQLKIQLGLDGKDELIEEYDKTVKYIEGNFTDAIDTLYAESQSRGGNVDFYSRPIIDAETMRKAGWSDFEDGEATYYSSSYSNEDGTKTILITPILPNGEVLSQEELDNYASQILSGVEIEHDILLGMWDGEDSIKQANKFGKSLSKASDEFDLQERSAKKIREYIRHQNLYTAQELVLLRHCVMTADTLAEGLESFELKNINTENNAERLTILKSNITDVQEEIEKIDEAIESSNSSMGLSAEQIDNIVAAFSGLEGYDYDELFESTASGVHLNAKELARLNGEYKKVQNKKYVDELERLEEQYQAVCVAIEDETDVLKRNNLIAKRNTLKTQIDEARELQAMYEGLTSAVSEYLRVKDRGEDGDTYQTIAEDWEEIEKDFSLHKVGTDKFKAYTQMWTSQDLSQLDPAQIAQIYGDARINKINRYMTFDDDGNVTDKGIDNFLTDIMNNENLGEKYASKDDNGNWIIDIIDTEELAKELDMADSLVQEFFKMALDYGAVLKFGEETDDLKALRLEAQEAQKILSDEYKFDLTVTDEGQLNQMVQGSSVLRASLVETFGEGSAQVMAFDQQVKWAQARLGEMAEEQYVVDIHSEDGIKKLNESLEELKKLGIIDISIDWTNNDPEYWKNKLTELEGAVNNLEKNKDGTINMSAPGAQELLQQLRAIRQAQRELEPNIIMDIDTSNLSDAAKQAADALQQMEEAAQKVEDREYELKLGLNTEKAVTDAENDLVDTVKILTDTCPSVVAKLGLDENSSAEEIQKVLNEINPKILADIDPSLVDGYIAEEKKLVIEGDVTDVTNKIDEIDKDLEKTRTMTFEEYGLSGIVNDYHGLVSKTISVTTEHHTVYSSSESPIQAKTPKVARASGTAYANGASGDWGAAQDETALVGELGAELRVNSKTGQWELLGKDGAEFADINKGDIIFNHKQTEQLFKQGYVTSGGGRGKAFINGTIGKLNSLFKVGSGSAYVESTVSGSWPRGDIHDIVANSLSQLPIHDSDSKDDFKETMDWVEIMIDRLERKIEDLDTVANSAYKNFTKRNKTLADEFKLVTDELALQQKAYNTYLAKANSVALSEEYKQKVRDGKLQIEDITNEDLKEKIDEYQEWYEKFLDCYYAITDLKEQLADLAKTNFDNIVSEFDHLLSRIEDTTSATEKALDIIEAKGNFASKSYFEDLMSIEQENLSMLRKEYTALQDAFDEAMSTGTIEENSEAFFEMQEQIREVESAIQDSYLALLEFKNQLWENDWSVFEKTIEYLDEITKESDFLVDLLSLTENDLFSKTSGKLTDAGLSVGGLHALDYNVYMAGAQAYAAKIEEINRELANDPTNTILLDKKNEYLELQRESIQAANDERTAIRDLIEESYNRQLEILQELIDKRKELLNTTKDLYDYERNISDQTKNITNLQKQLAALSGDTSEESKSKRQQLQTQLEEAEKDLEATEYDRWLQDQEKLLDDMITDYEEILMARLDDLDGLLTDMIETTNLNAEMINETITSAAGDVGYTITEGMQGIWDTASEEAKQVVSTFNADVNSGFGKIESAAQAATSTFTNTMTTTNSYIKSIYDLINKTVAKSESEKAQNSSPAKNPSTVNTNTAIGGSSSSSGNNTTSSSSTNSTSSHSSSSSSSSNSSSGGASFNYKYDSYPKDQLNVDTSIVDRMKYNNFDSSWSSMKQAYASMGLGSASSYTGSYSQNVAMLNWMKQNGYSNGGTIGRLVKSSGEDGFLLAKAGEHILNKEQLQIASAMVSQLIDFAKLQPNANAIRGMSYVNNGDNNVSFNFSLPNVSDSQSFLKAIQTDKKVQQALQSVTIGRAMNGNSLDVKRFK